MLSGESAIGSYGQKALSVLQMASSRMELWSREENRKNVLPQLQLGESLHDRIAEEICNAAAQLGKTYFSPLPFFFFFPPFSMTRNRSLLPYVGSIRVRLKTRTWETSKVFLLSLPEDWNMRPLD